MRHVCLAFDSRAGLEERARDFLAEGAAAGALTRFIAAEAPALPLPFVALGDTYADGAVVDPPAQVAAYTAATGAALAAGYSGLRVVADVTPLVRTPAQLDAFARYEFLIDRYIRDSDFTAMCAYDRAELGDDVIAELACMHSDVETPAPFQLHACPPGDGSAALAGELDLATDDLLGTTLRRTDLPGPGDEVVLQAGRLRFADHGSLMRLHEFAAERGTTVVLRDASPAIDRLARLLDLSRLRVEVAR
jgi:DcmR-like sensory protein/STAS domain-containing protein